MYKQHILTLILLEPKVISLCHHYRARPACTSVQSDQVILLADQLEVPILIPLKIKFKKWKWWLFHLRNSAGKGILYPWFQVN